MGKVAIIGVGQSAGNLFLNILMKTEDTQEGIRSYFEKRKPEWKNR